MHDPWLTWPVGSVLLLLGVVIRIWAQSHIHHRIEVPVRFTFSGPYQFVRNPLYIGNTLIILAATVFSGLLWLIPLSLAWCAISYSAIIRYEEDDLAERFGEPYLQYKARVPRWFPPIDVPKKLQFLNAYSGRAVLAELHCFLIILPFVIKDLVESFARHTL